jgi:hypothetical protein
MSLGRSGHFRQAPNMCNPQSPQCIQGGGGGLGMSFEIGNPAKLITIFPEPNLSNPSEFRAPPEGLVGIDQAIVDDPNLVLKRALEGKTIKNTVVLDVSSDVSTPVFGGGFAKHGVFTRQSE